MPQKVPVWRAGEVGPPRLGSSCLGGGTRCLDCTATCLGDAKHKALPMPAHKRIGQRRFYTPVSQAIPPSYWGLPESEGVRAVGRLHPGQAEKRLLRQRPKINNSAGSVGKYDA